MSGRIVSIFERGLTTTVNDIEHIESQSVPGFGIVKIYFQPRVNIAARKRRLRRFPRPPQATAARRHAAATSHLQRVERADLAARLVERLRRKRNSTISPEFCQAAAHQRGRCSVARALWRRASPGADRPRSAGVAFLRAGGAGCRQCARGAEPDHTGRNREDRRIRVHHQPQRFAAKVADFNDLPIKAVNGAMVYMRDVAFAHDGSPPQTNVVQIGWPQGRSHDRAQGRLGIDSRHHRRD